MALQSSKTTLENVLPAMDFILELLEMGKERFKDDEFMSSCINSACRFTPCLQMGVYRVDMGR
jgi:hypothetical protein